METVLSWLTIACLILLGYLSLSIMGFFSWGNKFPVEGRTVLLTGASYGMGKELAKLLSQRGASVILVARNVENLQAATAYAKAAAKSPSTQRFHYISADCTSEAENARLLAEATTWNNGKAPDIVWANAGSSTPGLFLDQKTDTLRQQMDINYWAACYLAQQTLKAWLYPSTPYKPTAPAEPTRHFIVTSSVLGFINIIGYGGYSPAKAALKTLCDGLRQEVILYNGARRSNNAVSGFTPAPFDIAVNMIAPATILSPGELNENRTKPDVTKKLEETDPKQTELEAATAAIKGLEAGNYSSATSWLGDLMRMSSMGSARRDNLVKDTAGTWVASLVWLLLGPDMDGKVFNWGKKEGMPAYKPDSV
ncbi:3-ketosphinganine reductase-like protein [Paraphaeosphaeria sporulosa]|uniref:3-ketosphinganine reductase-like protein n=1 Tax=Paraphaeosphaeria sporulosa TaxID=1460663 RepID=A0A177D064_9PLEO|nr:3-ketosphinganine reductase-like protein [Paraphaeosphaeria sporulosa]OAG12552.1 3-ketosphinganine reductase-like protein [Paraphaeosphaeria sporulosa]